MFKTNKIFKNIKISKGKSRSATFWLALGLFALGSGVSVFGTVKKIEWDIANSLNNIQSANLLISSTAKELSPGLGGVKGFSKDELIVKFKRDTSSGKRDEVLSRNSLKKKSEIEGLSMRLVGIPDGRNPQDVADHLMKREGDFVEFAEMNKYYAPDILPNDSGYASQWDKVKVGGPAAWDITVGSPGVIVAIIDTGTNCNHPDLAANCVAGYDFYNNDTDPQDEYGHGTKVAGDVAAVGNNSIGYAGMGWRLGIMPLKIAGPDGGGSTYLMAQALDFAASRGARVANISYQVTNSATVQAAARNFKSKGGLVTVSAGNYSTLTGFAAVPEIITVSATDNNDVKYSWSSYGNEVDVSAPGCTYTTLSSGSYGSGCGTSYAAPITAGVIGLIMSANPSLSAEQVQNILFTTAKDLGTSGWDQYYGWGRIDAESAVRQATTGGVIADTQAPDAPTNLQATASAGQVSLVWNNSSDNVGVAGYKIYRNGSNLATVTSNSYSDKTVLEGGQYSYYVTAFDAAGNSSFSSNAVSVLIPSVSLTISNISVSNKTANSAIINWTTNQPSNGLVSYGKSSDALTASASDNQSKTSHSVLISNLTPFSRYYFRIIASSPSSTSTTSSIVQSFRTNKR